MPRNPRVPGPGYLPKGGAVRALAEMDRAAKLDAQLPDSPASIPLAPLGDAAARARQRPGAALLGMTGMALVIALLFATLVVANLVCLALMLRWL